MWYARTSSVDKRKINNTVRDCMRQNESAIMNESQGHLDTDRKEQIAKIYVYTKLILKEITSALSKGHSGCFMKCAMCGEARFTNLSKWRAIAICTADMQVSF